MVWVISIFYVLSAGYTLLSFALVYSGAVSVRPEQAAYFQNLSVVDLLGSLLGGLLNFCGAIALFRLRKIAFILFALAFVLMCLQAAVQLLTTNIVAAMGGAGFIGALIGYAISLAVCWYAWRLKGRGILA